MTAASFTPAGSFRLSPSGRRRSRIELSTIAVLAMTAAFLWLIVLPLEFLLVLA